MYQIYRFRCDFLLPYFQSKTFNLILLFLQKATNKAKLKQVGKHGILEVQHVETIVICMAF
jgi:hypothetical protein